MRADQLFISLLILLLFLIGGTMIINEQVSVDVYNISVDNSTFNETQIHIDELNDAVASARTKLEKDPDKDETDIFGFLLVAGASAIDITANLISIPSDLMEDLVVLMHLPDELVILFTIGLISSIIFFIIYMYFRFQPR